VAQWGSGTGPRPTRFGVALREIVKDFVLFRYLDDRRILVPLFFAAFNKRENGLLLVGALIVVGLSAGSAQVADLGQLWFARPLLPAFGDVTPGD